MNLSVWQSHHGLWGAALEERVPPLHTIGFIGRIHGQTKMEQPRVVYNAIAMTPANPIQAH
jgi:hypothetical protein